jgi:hypothetical protein
MRVKEVTVMLQVVYSDLETGRGKLIPQLSRNLILSLRNKIE